MTLASQAIGIRMALRHSLKSTLFKLVVYLGMRNEKLFEESINKKGCMTSIYNQYLAKERVNK